MKFSSLVLLACLCVGPFPNGFANQGAAPPQRVLEEDSGPQWEQRKFEEALNLIHIGFARPGGVEPAYKILNEISKRNPSSPYLYAAAAELQYLSYANSGGTTAQEVRAVAYRAIQLKPDMPDPYVVLAKVEAKEGNVVQAQKAANTAIKLAPNKPEAMFAMAQAAEAARDFTAAETWYMKDIAVLSDVTRKSNIYFWLCEMHLKKRPPDVPKALTALKKSIEIEPGQAGKRVHLAEVLNWYSDRYDEAIEAATAAFKLKDNADTRRMLAIALYAKWAETYLRPAGTAEKQQVLGPEAIARRTGFTSVDMFAQTGWYKGGLPTAEALLKAGLIKDVDAVPATGCCTALVTAAQGDNVELARLLIDHGANVNAEYPEDKRTALYQFAVLGDAAGVQLLLSKGARVNIVDSRGTPLLHAAFRRDEPNGLPITRQLLKAGADPSLPDRDGANLLLVAVQKQNGAALELLLNEYRMDPNSADATGRTALAWIIGYLGTNRREIVQTLLTAGANPWVEFGRGDALAMVEFHKPGESERGPEDRDVAALLREARSRFPKPADFPEWHPAAQTRR